MVWVALVGNGCCMWAMGCVIVYLGVNSTWLIRIILLDRSLSYPADKYPVTPIEKVLYYVSFSENMTHMYKRILGPRCKTILKQKSLLILGPRQVGKSTLIRSLNPNLVINLANQREYFEHLKDPALLERMVNKVAPTSLIFVDEIQRVPSLLNTIQALVDENPKIRFALTGSSARKLMRGKANLLPGRVLYEKLFPITYWELDQKLDSNVLQQILIQGSLPEVIESDFASDLLESYVDTYLREEIQAEALTRDLGDYSRFLSIAAEVSGQFLNYSSLASETEINKEKIRRYFEILSDTLLIHRIESYGEISTTRKVRQRDKFIFFDNGVRNALLKKTRNKFTNTELGPLFEQWITQQVIAWNQYHKKNWRISTYRDDRGLEVDLIIETSTKMYLIEVKYQTKFRPDFTNAIREFATLKGTKAPKIQLIVVYLGQSEQKSRDGELILPLDAFMKYIETI